MEINLAEESMFMAEIDLEVAAAWEAAKVELSLCENVVISGFPDPEGVSGD